MLRREGYDVREAEDGAEALRILSDTALAPDLVLSDVVMPGMSGPELLRELARVLPHTPTLLMSGYARTASASNELLDGSAPFLAKPFTRQELVSAVSAALDAPAAQVEQRMQPDTETASE
jgi:DNA-binding NtrC family response regulator